MSCWAAAWDAPKTSPMRPSRSPATSRGGSGSAPLGQRRIPPVAAYRRERPRCDREPGRLRADRASPIAPTASGKPQWRPPQAVSSCCGRPERSLMYSLRHRLCRCDRRRDLRAEAVDDGTLRSRCTWRLVEGHMGGLATRRGADVGSAPSVGSAAMGPAVTC